jgi:hypothetical protein
MLTRCADTAATAAVGHETADVYSIAVNLHSDVAATERSVVSNM